MGELTLLCLDHPCPHHAAPQNRHSYCHQSLPTKALAGTERTNGRCTAAGCNNAVMIAALRVEPVIMVGRVGPVMQSSWLPASGRLQSRPGFRYDVPVPVRTSAMKPKMYISPRLNTIVLKIFVFTYRAYGWVVHVLLAIPVFPGSHPDLTFAAVRVRTTRNGGLTRYYRI